MNYPLELSYKTNSKGLIMTCISVSKILWQKGVIAEWVSQSIHTIVPYCDPLFIHFTRDWSRSDALGSHRSLSWYIINSKSTKSRIIGAEATRLPKWKVGRLWQRRLTEVLDFRRVLNKFLLLSLRELGRLVVASVLLPADQFPATWRHRDENVNASTTKHTHTLTRNAYVRTERKEKKSKREWENGRVRETIHCSEGTEVGWRTARSGAKVQ